MKSYAEIEPIPDYKLPRYWPIWVSWVPAVVITFLLPDWFGAWRYLAYLPYAVFLGRYLLLAWLRYRRFNREIDAWDERMKAHYLNIASQREKGIWS